MLVPFAVLALVHTIALGKATDKWGIDSKISINVENATLDDIFSILEKKTAFHFNYGGDIMKDTRTFSLTYSNKPLHAILDALAGSAEVQYNVSGKTILIKKKNPGRAGNQQQTLNGKVVDASGQPLPGASVMEKGTSNGVATDFDGNFTINVSGNNAVLIVSYIGFVTREVTVPDDSNTVTISLKEDAQGLDEVVVTALGITREEKKIGYATQDIELGTIEEVSTPNVGNLFSGQVAGLSVTNPTGLFQSPSFSLRGKTPLIVIDGIPVETDFFDVSSNDIADINVLKGTTASALYGSRGRNGAILITTKNATEEGLEISVSHNTMVTAGFTAFPETQTEYGNGSNGKYEFWDGQDGGISDGDMIWGPKFEPGVMIPQWNSPIRDNETGETIPWWGDVSGTEYNDKSRYSRVPIPWEYHDNLKDFLETGYVSTTDFAIAHKGKKGTFRISGMFSEQKDRVPNASLKRGGLSFKATTKLTDRLTLDSKLAYNKVYSPNYPRHGYGPKNHMYTILIWMGDDVNGKELREHLYVPGQEGYRQANWNYAWYNNPYFAAYELNQTYDANVINSQLKLNYEVTDDLNLQARASAVLKDRFEDRQSPKSYLNYSDPRDGDYKTWNRERLNVDYDILATYNKSVSDNFGFTVNAGASAFYRKFQEEYNATDGLAEPWVYSLNNSRGSLKGSTYLEEKAIHSIYATAELDIYNALFLNFAARNDWSSTLPESSRSYFYPSLSASTLVSNYIKLPKAIDFLKLYGSWAEVSSDLDPYEITPYYINDANGENEKTFGSTPRITYPGGIVNPNIKPEKSTSFELGMNSSFLTGRLKLGFTYYNVVDTNQIIDLPISIASGFGSRKVNGNEYTTNGYEVVLNATPVLTDDFRWDITTNWSTWEKKITGIYGGQERFGDLYLNDRADSFYAEVWQKAPDGQLILNDEGLPVKDNFKQKIGHRAPDWLLGLQNSFRYKKFTLNVGIDGVWGGIMRSQTIEKMWWGGKHPNSTEYRDAEYAAGEPVYVPEGVNVVSGELNQDVNGNVISDTRVFGENTTAVNWQTWSQNYPYRARVTTDENEKFANVFDRTFFKLRSVSLKYDFTDLLNIGGVQHIDMTLNGYNLLVWKKADIIDPDFGSGRSEENNRPETHYGDDNNLQDPSSRYIGLGINVKF
ncbi:SusC/RagA family TonB-linked outer membrane protein [Sinomicrobium kalidii]|uniref:SusC/RagA family TonB-linked outer membrane protein n=1 Tax=Sinomicrobium kalidii TaxID=2900738 RepID=UPI001E2FA5EE|nr:SusC/RagA family TonB-linked outer membrane protein [Sinomicrobium kalidii]UGU15682.1 SusC/RagA family TonB-linked outer membrane protein [Sinomicrobium kalidii]